MPTWRNIDYSILYYTMEFGDKGLKDFSRKFGTCVVYWLLTFFLSFVLMLVFICWCFLPVMCHLPSTSPQLIVFLARSSKALSLPSHAFGVCISPPSSLQTQWQNPIQFHSKEITSDYLASSMQTGDKEEQRDPISVSLWGPNWKTHPLLDTWESTQKGEQASLVLLCTVEPHVSSAWCKLPTCLLLNCSIFQLRKWW